MRCLAVLRRPVAFRPRRTEYRRRREPLLFHPYGLWDARPSGLSRSRAGDAGTLRDRPSSCGDIRCTVSANGRHAFCACKYALPLRVTGCLLLFANRSLMDRRRKKCISQKKRHRWRQSSGREHDPTALTRVFFYPLQNYRRNQYTQSIRRCKAFFAFDVGPENANLETMRQIVSAVISTCPRLGIYRVCRT